MNMINSGTGSLELIKRIEQLEQENQELKDRVDAITKLILLPFIPSEGINSLFVYKSDIGMVIRNFYVAANTKLPVVTHVTGGYTYYVIGKIEGENPFGFKRVDVISAGMIFLANSSGGLAPLNIWIYYDGTNTYLIQTVQYSNVEDLNAISIGQSTLFEV